VAHLGLVSVLRQPTPAALLKRSLPVSPDVKPQPQPLPSRAIPMALWEDHLLPLLTCKDAARLGCTCKTLRGVVRDYFKDLGVIKMDSLQAALTTFPRARGVTLDPPVRDVNDTEVEALVEWLREGARGKELERVTMKRNMHGPGNHLAHKALREGALPSLRSLDARLEYLPPSLTDKRARRGHARAATYVLYGLA
jgi:hypothetical protein